MASEAEGRMGYWHSYSLVISSWLWWVKRVLLANQNGGNILEEK